MNKLKYLVAITLFCLLVGGSYLLAERQFHSSLIEEAEDRSQLYVASVKAAKDRLAHLPGAVAIHPDVAGLFDESVNRSGNEGLVQNKALSFNKTLKKLASLADADALYVMDAKGNTLASSNYDTTGSFVGRNYGFRPYFQTAIGGVNAEYFAVGATTGRPGYFVSAPIHLNGKIVGASVVKTEFEDLLSDWATTDELVAVVDENGIIILSGNPQIQYRSILPLTDASRKLQAESRQYGDLEIRELPFESADGTFSGNIGFGEQTFTTTRHTIPGSDWTLYYLSEFAPVRNGALSVAAVAALLSGFLLLGALYAFSRQRQREFEFQAREAEVIRKINQELRTEIGVRADTEAQLREMQSELVTTARLAALGKMSAAIVHEVNQPVSAINNYAASGILMLDRKDRDGVKNTLGQIRKMTDRLASITSDLLIFSRKPVTSKVRVDLNSVLQEVVEQLDAAGQFEGIELQVQYSDEAPVVMGKLARMEQLASNLLKNAAQAAHENETPQVSARTICEPEKAIIEIEDNGFGFSEETREQLFEPFFTTKPVGQGIGMGLAICFAIVEEAGGRIVFNSQDDAWKTLFRVEIPAEANTIVEPERVVEHA